MSPRFEVAMSVLTVIMFLVIFVAIVGALWLWIPWPDAWRIMLTAALITIFAGTILAIIYKEDRK